MEHRWKVLILYATGEFIAFLDAPVVTVAFPAIREDFPQTSLTTLAWVLDAYFVAFAALLVTAGVLADRFGRRLVFLTGLWAFAAGSLVGAVAPTAGILIAARTVQGLGAALMVPAGLGLMLAEFPPHERKRAIGINAAVIGLASAISPAIGGIVVDGLSWRWLFSLNLPVVLAAVLVTHRILPRDRGNRAETPPPDFLGAALQTLGVSLIVLAILKRQEWGTTEVRTVASFTAGLAATLAAIFRQPQGRLPVIDRELFTDRTFRIANLSVFMFSIGFFSVTVSSVLFMTSVWGYSVLQAGLAFAPGALVVAVLGGPAGQIADRYGSWTISVAGCFLGAAGLALIVLSTSAHPEYLAAWLPGQIIYGSGLVCAITGLIGAAVTAVPSSKFAIGSGLNTAVRQVGGAIGVAIAVATLNAAVPGDALGRAHTAFVIAAITMVIGGMIAWFLRGAEVSEELQHEAAAEELEARGTTIG